MVLSPIEPVAPSTVTVRTAETAALLLRRGTALIVSPNHKTAADAIRAGPQEPENRRHDDGCDKSVQAVQQSAVAGNDLAGVLDAKPPFHRRLEEITELRDDREKRAQEQQWPGFTEIEARKAGGHGETADKAADG